MNEVNALLTSTIKGLRSQEPALAKSLKKWLPLLKSTVNDLERITHKDPIDLTQDLILAVVESNIAYKAPLFRYNKKLYELDMQDGPIFRLTTPKYKKTKILEKFWIHKRRVVPVRKSSLDSYLYSVISQQYLDMLTLYFTQRNGWLRTSPRKSKIKTVERIGQEVLECDFGKEDSEMFNNMFKDTHSDQESVASARDMLKKIMYRISQNALVVLMEMWESPYSSAAELSRGCKMSKNVVSTCKKQIKRAAMDLTSIQPIYLRKVSPMYLTNVA
jgi:hypothetical protein